MQRKRFVTDIELDGSWEEELIARFLAHVGLEGRLHSWGTGWNGKVHEGVARAHLGVTAARKVRTYGKQLMELSVTVEYTVGDAVVAWTERGLIRLWDERGNPVDPDDGWRERLKPYRVKADKHPPWERAKPERFEPRAFAVSPRADRGVALFRKERGSVAQVVSLPDGEVLAKKSFQRFSSDSLACAGDLLVAPGLKSIWVFDVSTKTHRNLKAGKHQVQVVRVAPDGATVAAGSGENWRPFDFGVRVFVGAERRWWLKGHGAIVIGLDFLPDERLVSVDLDFNVRVWDLNYGTPIAEERMPGPARPPTAGSIHLGERAWPIGGRILALHRGSLKLWRLGADELDAELPASGRARVSPSGEVVLVEPRDDSAVRVQVSPSGGLALVQVRDDSAVRVLGDLHKGELADHQIIDVPEGAVAAFASDDTIAAYSPSGITTHAVAPLASLAAPLPYEPRPEASPDSPADPRAALAARGIEPTHKAIFDYIGDLDTLRQLLEAGVPADAVYPGTVAHAGARVLEWAVGRNEHRAAKLLLESGADPDIESSYGTITDADGTRRQRLVETTSGRMRKLLERWIAAKDA